MRKLLTSHLPFDEWTEVFGSERLTGALLDGVVVASLGLMAAVTWHLGRSAIVDAPTAGLAVVAAAILVTLRPNSAWLVLGGAVAGWILRGGT